MKRGALVLAIALAACGGDDDAGDGGPSDGGATTCQMAGMLRCAKACACASMDETCRIGSPQGYLNFTDEQDCRAFYVDLQCSNNTGVDYPACLTALSNTSCVDLGDGTGNQTLPDPPECAGSLADGGVR